MKKLTTTLLVAGVIGFTATLQGAPAFDQLVTPDVIFGSGNANGSFTTETKDGIEVGLRAKQRYPAADIFNSNGDGTYSFAAGNACTLAGAPAFPACIFRPIWNFEWSVNTDVSGLSGAKVGDYTYELGMDADPSDKTDFTVFDPITPVFVAPFFDHSFGDNSTGNGLGTEAVDPVTYAANLATLNVAQQSWNYDFYNNLGTSLERFDPEAEGSYTIYLQVREAPKKGSKGSKASKGSKSKGKVVVEVEIEVIVSNP